MTKARAELLPLPYVFLLILISKLFPIPQEQKDHFLHIAKRYHFQEMESPVSAMEALGEFVEMEKLPGITLRVHRENANLTQKDLAEKLGVKQHHISEMEHSKRPVGKELAKKIAAVLHTGYREYL